MQTIRVSRLLRLPVFYVGKPNLIQIRSHLHHKDFPNDGHVFAGIRLT